MKVKNTLMLSFFVLCSFHAKCIIGADYGSEFALLDHHLYSYRNDQISAIAAENGSSLWSFQIPGPGGGVDVPPIVERGAVVFCAGGSAQIIFALDASTGKLLWKDEGNCRAISSSAGKVYVLHRPDGSISSLDAQTGRRLWRNEGNGAGSTIIALRNRVITDNIQVDANTGKTMIRSRFHRRLLGATERGIFWEASMGQLICSSLGGRDIWKVSMPLPHIIQFQSDPAGESIVASDGYAYVGTSAILLRFDVHGRELWRNNISGKLPISASSFTQYKELLLLLLPVDSRFSVVRAFTKSTGKEIWVSVPLENVVGPVVGAPDKLFLGTRSGQIEVLSELTRSISPL